ncbi:MAG: chemotaxis protein MotB [Bdellovibrionaceae bacterium]|jgi:chemotaxis protein MotB|nr:chemotaxis protein MotB [Pseudobdellovibrionaceae bacterium]
MAAEKKGKATIVIKKTYISGGHHGGAWKVALADFMTAMMAFFMVMWLLGQSEETKKNVAEYFSTPSIVEYNYNNFGALLTLEKLFLDFINSPLEAVASFIRPMDKLPNILDFGSEAIVDSYLRDELQELAESGLLHRIDEDGLNFALLDTHFFEKGSSRLAPQFTQNSEKLKGILSGLKDAIVNVEVQLFEESVPDSDVRLAKQVAVDRLQVMVNRVEGLLTDPTVTVTGSIKISKKSGYREGDSRPHGLIVFDIRQKPVKSDGTEYRKIQRVFGKSQSHDVYEDFVKKITTKPAAGDVR